MSPTRYEYLLIAYHPTTGEQEGYLTDRGTMTDWLERAVRYGDEKIAEGQKTYLESAPGWRFFIWVVDPVKAHHHG